MPRIHLTSRDSHLKSDWWEWMCQKEMEDGTLINGYVQADGTGNMIAEETFESAYDYKCGECGLPEKDPRCCQSNE